MIPALAAVPPGALALLLILASARRRHPWWRWAAFAACHLGAAAVIVGGLLGHLAGVRGAVIVPANGRVVRELRVGPPGRRAAPGFGLALRGFAIAHHPPDFVLYRREGVAWSRVRRLRLPADGELDLGPAGHVAVAELRRGDGWVRHRLLGTDWLLRRCPPRPRQLRGSVRFTDGARGELAVNHPLDHRGWRFYLAGYRPASTRAQPVAGAPVRLVELIVRRDPGRPWALVGLWLLIVGTAVLCMAPRRSNPATEGRER